MTVEPAPRRRLKGFIALYVLLLAVGSLYPFTGWSALADWSASFITDAWPRYITRTDLATNLLIYLPLGYALARWFARPGHGAYGVIVGTIFGLGISLVLESGQQLLPGRIASNLDMLVNGLGALSGALLTLHHGRWLRAGRALHRWRDQWFHAGISTNIGLGLLLLWFFSQFALLPFPGIGWLGLYLRPIDTPPGGLDQINFPWLAAIALEMTTLGVFTANLLRPGRYVSGMLLLITLAFMMKLLAATILLKLKVVGGVLSLETLAGFLLAFWILLLQKASRMRHALALTCMVVVIVVRLSLSEKILPSVSLLNITGLGLHLAAFWPAFALGWLLQPHRQRH